jgi:hypothetical protein
MTLAPTVAPSWAPVVVPPSSAEALTANAVASASAAAAVRILMADLRRGCSRTLEHVSADADDVPEPLMSNRTTAARLDEPPDRWAGVLTPEQWRAGVELLGEPRLDELHGLFAEVSEAFRASFLEHLARTAPVEPAGSAVLLALACAADDSRPERRGT